MEHDARWQRWLDELATTLSVDPEELYYRTVELLYEGGASPREAADFIRINGAS